VALQLAQVLGTTVDQLFATAPELRQAAATPLGPAPPDTRVRLASVWDRWVALPLIGDRAAVVGFVPASGRWLGRHSAQIWGNGRSLVIAGCDPAIPLLAEPVAAAREGWTVEWWPCANREALRLLDEGMVHAAAIHLPRGQSGAVGAIRNRARIGFASWREGVLLRRASGASQAESLEAALSLGLRWVNREAGSEARQLLDRELERLGASGSELDGYHSEAAGHLQVGSAIASGIADLGIATEPAGLAYDLHFLPLSEEDCLLHVDRDRLDTAELRLLLAALGGPGLGRELSALAGYDTSILGQEF
jgi:molybdate-binding protein